MTPEEQDQQSKNMRMNGMSPSGFVIGDDFVAFVDSEIGMSMGETKVNQRGDGTWLATCPIGTLFGQEVDGECKGEGKTREEALENLAKDRKTLNDSLWA